MLVSGQGFRASVIDSWGNTENRGGERAAANLISEFCKHNTHSWKQSLHQKYYSYSYQERKYVTYEFACFCGKLTWVWETVINPASYSKSPILSWSSSCVIKRSFAKHVVLFFMISPFLSFVFLFSFLPFICSCSYQPLFSFSLLHFLFV